VLDRYFRLLAVLGLLVLAGCGWFRDSGNDYQAARELPPMAVPEGMDASRIQPFYVIPPAQGSAIDGQAFEVPRPDPLGAGANDQAVRIQKLADEQWAVVSMAPDQTWPLLKIFLEANRVPMVREDGQQGLMITDWLQPEGDLPREQYLIRIDAGVQPGSSEVHVRQRVTGMDGITWPARSDNREREYKFLYQLSTHLASQTDAASVSLLAQGIRAASKISLQQTRGQPFLLLELPYPRGWASVGNALESADLELIDQDYTAGVYQVREIIREQPGWWARLWGAEKKEARTLQLSVVTMGESRVGILVEGDNLSANEQVHILQQLKGQLR